MIQSFHASVTQGGGTLTVAIDRILEGSDSDSGIADISLEIPVGVHGIDLDAVVDLYDSPELGLPDDATAQDVLDALDATGEEFYIIWLDFFSDAESEVQWLAFGDETHWFGTDAEWFLNDPSCGTVVPDPTPTPESNSAPTKPVLVETGVLD